jgi:hypothetical protein
MRDLVRQLRDAQLSRRGFVQRLTALGASAASALLATVAKAGDATSAVARSRAATGSGVEVRMDMLLAANVRYRFYCCGGGINAFFHPVVNRCAVPELPLQPVTL